LFKETIYPWERLGDLGTELARLEDIPDDDIAGVRQKEKRYEAYIHSGNYLFTKFWADTWCAAFVWKKTEAFGYPITEEVFRKVEGNPHSIEKWMHDEIIRLAEQYQFFHWHLAFPNVFGVAKSVEEAENQKAGWNDGFDVLLGNPPWEKVEIEEIPFFASRRPEIANLQTASQRKKAIQALRATDPTLYQSWLEYQLTREKEREFIRGSGNYPLTGSGKFNTYALFAELARRTISLKGRTGLVVQGGIATDSTTSEFFGDLVSTQTLAFWYEFENSEGIFPGIHRQMRFGIITILGSGAPREYTRMAFELSSIHDLNDTDRLINLYFDEFPLFNPNTVNCPKFKTSRDYKIARQTYKRFPILMREVDPIRNPWNVDLKRMVNMADDSEHFRTLSQLIEIGCHEDECGNFTCQEGLYLRLYESKMFAQYDHRLGTFEGLTQEEIKAGNCRELKITEKQSPLVLVVSRYWMPVDAVDYKLKLIAPDKKWLLAYRDITNATNERTVICSVIPKTPVGHTAFLISSAWDAQKNACLLANLNSFVFDFLARQKLSGTHLSLFILKQLPIIPPNEYTKTWADLIVPCVLELSYTAKDLQPFATDCGYIGESFRWDEERRFLLRCELDAAYFHLYGIEREDVDYILETFPIIKRKDEQAHGEYHTKSVILEIYDVMQRAIELGEPYQTCLNPPPVDLSAAHPPQIQAGKIILPQGERIAFDNDVIYLTLVIFTLLHESGGSIDTQRLMNVCKLLAQPDKLENHGAILEGSIAHEWRQRYCDKLDPELFLPVLDNLIRQAQIKLVPHGTGSKTVFVDPPEFRIDADVRFDVLFALKVSDALPETSLAEMPEVVRSTELEKRYSSTR
jgi:hypothetical protein